MNKNTNSYKREGDDDLKIYVKNIPSEQREFKQRSVAVKS
jgi:archaellum component FlaG (FlaF/FlaG flagellin family)